MEDFTNSYSESSSCEYNFGKCWQCEENLAKDVRDAVNSLKDLPVK